MHIPESCGLRCRGWESLLGIVSAQSSWPSAESSLTAMPPSRDAHKHSEGEWQWTHERKSPGSLQSRTCTQPKSSPHMIPQLPRLVCCWAGPACPASGIVISGWFQWGVLGVKSGVGAEHTQCIFGDQQFQWIPHLCGHENGGHSALLPPSLLVLSPKAIASLTLLLPAHLDAFLPVYGTTYPANQHLLA